MENLVRWCKFTFAKRDAQSLFCLWGLSPGSTTVNQAPREGSVTSLANERNIHSWETMLCIWPSTLASYFLVANCTLFSQAFSLGCKFACTSWHKRIGAKHREVCFLGQQKRTKAGGKNRKRTNLKGSDRWFFSSFSISSTLKKKIIRNLT